jgi:hypothetical protein
VSYVLDLGTAASYVEASASQSNIGTASALAIKIRVQGQMLLDAAGAFDTFYIAEVGGGADASMRLRVFINGGSGNVQIGADCGGSLGNTWTTQEYASGSVVAADYYEIYVDHTAAAGNSNTAGFVGLAKNGIQLVGPDTSINFSNSMPSSTSNGRVRVGARFSSTTNGVDEAIDGIAVYGARLSSGDYYTAPSQLDADILGFWPFDEGAGTSTANAVSGGQALDTFSGTVTWVAGGTWTGVALEQEGFRWRNDDGDEDAATWLDTQDTDITAEEGANVRLRILVNASGDPASTPYQLEFKKTTGSLPYSSAFTKVPTGTTIPYTVDETVGLGTDDAQQAGTTVTLTGTTIGGSLDAVTEWVGMRFQTVAIPAGATITNAYLSVVPSATGEDEPLVTVYFEDADDAATFTTTASDISNRARTSGVSWSSTDLGASGSTYHNSPDLSSILQTVINRGGWASGNDLAVIVQGGATATRDLTIEAYENAGANPPRLHVEYTLPAPVKISVSAHITASGEVTTAQLTAPSGKTTGDFVAGRIQDDENPSDTVNIGADEYTELEWCIQAVSGVAVDTDVYQFRVTANGTALSSYPALPEWTIGAPAGGVTLTVQDATHGHSVDAPTLTQANTLAVADSSHAHTADSPTPTVAFSLTVADAGHTHTVDNPTLTQANTLAPAGADHGHTVDSPSLTQANVLDPDESLHAHTADAPTLDLPGILSVHEATHGHTADNVALTQAGTLAVQDALHGHTADNVSLSQGIALVVAEALHAHGVDSPALVQAYLLVVAEALHAHAADGVTLTQAHLLSVADALHAHLAESVFLGEPLTRLTGVLTVRPALEGALAVTPTLTGTLTLAAELAGTLTLEPVE